jgi:hypothetical protein
LIWTRLSICTVISKNWNNLKLELPMNPNWKCLALISFALPHIVRMWVRSCNIISTQILSHVPNLGVSPKPGSQHFAQSQFTKLSNSSYIYLFCTHIIITKFKKCVALILNYNEKCFTKFNPQEFLPNLQEQIVSYVYNDCFVQFNFITLHVSIHSKLKIVITKSINVGHRFYDLIIIKHFFSQFILWEL